MPGTVPPGAPRPQRRHNRHCYSQRCCVSVSVSLLLNAAIHSFTRPLLPERLLGPRTVGGGTRGLLALAVTGSLAQGRCELTGKDRAWETPERNERGSRPRRAGSRSGLLTGCKLAVWKRDGREFLAEVRNGREWLCGRVNRPHHGVLRPGLTWTSSFDTEGPGAVWSPGFPPISLQGNGRSLGGEGRCHL